jgi:hydrogenase nickel incorporation protein HypA/HybF
MHDLDLARRIVRLALSEASSAGRSRVKTVRVRIGAWTCSDADHLRHSFEFASRGTPAEGAELQVELVQPSARCEDCGASFQPGKPTLACAECGSPRVKLGQSREIELESVGY